MAIIMPIGALSVTDVIPNLTEGQLKSLYENEIVKGVSFKDDIKTFVPKNSIAEKHLLDSLKKDDSFTVVSLVYIPFPNNMINLSDSEKQLKIFNTMRSISTQEGIEYISHRAGDKPKVLIEKSWYLETPKSRTGLDDPISSSFPSNASYYVYQRDTSFGSNVYQHDYETTDKEIFVKVTNLETIRVFSLFKAVDKGKLAIAMDTHLLEDGILLTAMATIEGRSPEVKVLGFSVDLPSAFSRRTTALGNWFVQQLNN